MLSVPAEYVRPVRAVRHEPQQDGGVAYVHRRHGDEKDDRLHRERAHGVRRQHRRAAGRGVCVVFRRREPGGRAGECAVHVSGEQH